jgi:hypothetical protein
VRRALNLEFGLPLTSANDLEHLADNESSATPERDLSKYNPTVPDVEISAAKNNKAIVGRFCQFGLAAKFPYKYMNDSNDKVSKYFFASNKFYDHTWDL